MAEPDKKKALESKSASTQRAKLQTFDTIDAEEITWLWEGRIAIGKLTIYAGDPGIGKSQASLDLATRLSRGTSFPDGKTCPIGDTIILTLEDDPADTIRPRLDALDADNSRVHFLHGRVDLEGNDRGLATLKDLNILIDACKQIYSRGGWVKLLIVDPLDGFLDGADAHKTAEIREVLGPLCLLAQEKQFAILGIMHLNKSSGLSTAYRVTGGIGFTAVSRSVWVFSKDPHNEGRRVMISLKNNLGRDEGGLEFSIESVGKVSRFVWGAPANDSLSDMLSHTLPKRTCVHAPEQDKVLVVLKANAPSPMQTKDIALTIGKRSSATGNLLSKLEGTGQVKRAADHFGLWELAAETEAESTFST